MDFEVNKKMTDKLEKLSKLPGEKGQDFLIRAATVFAQENQPRDQTLEYQDQSLFVSGQGTRQISVQGRYVEPLR